MYTKEKAIEVVNEICKAHKDIKLNIGEIGSAGWHKEKETLTVPELQDIRAVSTLSAAFDITQKDLDGE